MVYKEKLCSVCGISYFPKSGNQIYCGSIKNKTGCSYKIYIQRCSKNSNEKWHRHYQRIINRRLIKQCNRCGEKVIGRTWYHKICLVCDEVRNIKNKKEKKIKSPLRNRYILLEKYQFTCQYCGRKAPEVILEIDHIIPKSKGGENKIENLIVACKDCNLGKGDYILINH